MNDFQYFIVIHPEGELWDNQKMILDPGVPWNTSLIPGRVYFLHCGQVNHYLALLHNPLQMVSIVGAPTLDKGGRWSFKRFPKKGHSDFSQKREVLIKLVLVLKKGVSLIRALTQKEKNSAFCMSWKIKHSWGSGCTMSPSMDLGEPRGQSTWKIYNI